MGHFFSLALVGFFSVLVSSESFATRVGVLAGIPQHIAGTTPTNPNPFISLTCYVSNYSSVDQVIKVHRSNGGNPETFKEETEIVQTGATYMGYGLPSNGTWAKVYNNIGQTIPRSIKVEVEDSAEGKIHATCVMEITEYSRRTSTSSWETSKRTLWLPFEGGQGF